MIKPSDSPLVNMKEIGMDEIAAISIRQVKQSVEKATGKTAEEIQSTPLSELGCPKKIVSSDLPILNPDEVNGLVDDSVRDD